MEGERRKRREFTLEERQEALRLVKASGRPVAAVARELGINEHTMWNWVSRANREAAMPGGPLTPEEKAEMRKLRRENARLKMENEFLKKAAAFFARLDEEKERHTR
jgi:transposase-like protein